MKGWQPIETAPKDGQQILGYESGAISVMSWEDSYRGARWEWKHLVWGDESCEVSPTHWMPIPAPPQEAS